MRDGVLAPRGGIVEADETYLWEKAGEQQPSKQRRGAPFTKRGKSGPANKRAIVSLVQRGGSVRSFHVENADKATATIIVSENIAREARLHTDESRIYGDTDRHVADHHTVKHSIGE